MAEIACKSVKSLVKARIHCPSCNMDFALYQIKHVCNPLVPCARKPKTQYEECYLPDVDSGGARVVIADCNECETSRRKLVEAREATCPECDYTGWYVHDDSKLCPVCVSKNNENATRITKPQRAKSAAVKQSAACVAPKPRLDLYIEIPSAELESAPDSRCHIIVRGCTLESLNTAEWWVVKWENHPWEKVEESNDFHKKSMRQLSDFLAELGEKYDFQWQIARGSVVKIRLFYLYQKYGPENKTPLKLEW